MYSRGETAAVNRCQLGGKTSLPINAPFCGGLVVIQGGGLGCNWAEARVMALAWNDRDQVLYIGGEEPATQLPSCK